MPTYPLRHLNTDDIPQMLALYQKVGWGHRAAALKQLLMWCGQGAFGITFRKTLIATSTAIMYGQQRGWIGMVATDPAYQKQGFGSRITDTAIDHLKTRQVKEIMLDASGMGLPVYLRRGFRTVSRVNTWVGIAPGEVSAPKLRSLRADDVDIATRLDGHAFGVERPQVMKTLITARGNRGWIIADRAFIIAQEWHEQSVKLGSWVANNAENAESLLLAAMQALPDYQLIISVPEENEGAAGILEKHQFAITNTLARMIYGDVPDPVMRNQAYFGVVNLAVG
ncbi:MAG TPA: GNAT family N-acetyltransferase [Aggregatilineales bacterium]|nr:GNAT family N-acetyltransferase [Aggregatilineales bacterium]